MTTDDLKRKREDELLNAISALLPGRPNLRRRLEDIIQAAPRQDSEELRAGNRTTRLTARQALLKSGKRAIKYKSSKFQLLPQELRDHFYTFFGIRFKSKDMIITAEDGYLRKACEQLTLTCRNHFVAGFGHIINHTYELGRILDCRSLMRLAQTNRFFFDEITKALFEDSIYSVAISGRIKGMLDDMEILKASMTSLSPRYLSIITVSFDEHDPCRGFELLEDVYNMLQWLEGKATGMQKLTIILPDIHDSCRTLNYTKLDKQVYHINLDRHVRKMKDLVMKHIGTLKEFTIGCLDGHFYRVVLTEEDHSEEARRVFASGISEYVGGVYEEWIGSGQCFSEIIRINDDEFLQLSNDE